MKEYIQKFKKRLKKPKEVIPSFGFFKTIDGQVLFPFVWHLAVKDK